MHGCAIAKSRAEHRVWKVRGRALVLDRVLVMGIVNVTPDSFADGGRYFNHSDALAHARQLIDEGADIIDIGGESTRPGADEVSSDEEIRRVLPLLEALAGMSIPLSVDTSKPEVMRAALGRWCCHRQRRASIAAARRCRGGCRIRLRRSADAHARHARARCSRRLTIAT